MAILLLEIIEAIRIRLDDFGGDRGPPSAGYYAQWQQDDAPCLWKNRELVDYLHRALLDIAGRSPWTEEGAVADTMGVPTRLPVQAGNPEVILPESVLSVEQVRLTSLGRMLTKSESGRLAAQYGEEWADSVGIPLCYLEPRRGLLRLFPIPAQDDEIRLIVKRRCLAVFGWDDVAHEAMPTFLLADVPADLKEALVVGVCRYAFLKQDSMGFNIKASQDCERQLVELVGPPVSWRQKEARRENANLSTGLRGHQYLRR